MAVARLDLGSPTATSYSAMASAALLNALVGAPKVDPLPENDLGEDAAATMSFFEWCWRWRCELALALALALTLALALALALVLVREELNAKCRPSSRID